MKIDWNKKYTTIAVYAFLVIAACIVFGTVLQNWNGFGDYTAKLMELFMPFIYGFVIAYILNPILRMFDKRLLPLAAKGRIKPSHRRALSILFTYIVALMFLSLFFSFVIPEITSSVTGIVLKFSDYWASAEEFLNNVFATLRQWGIDDSNIERVLKSFLESFDTWLENIVEMIKASLPAFINATRQFADAILNIVLGVIISIYLLMSKEKFFAQLKKTLHAFLPAPAVDRAVYIAHKSHTTFSGFINGKLLDSLIIGILCFIGMTVFRMPNAVLVSVIVGVTNVIPYFGPFIGAIPSAIIILLTDPVKTIWFLIFILALQQFDGNILGPKILGETTGLSAFWVIFAIVVFSSLLGVAGMFIGVPLFAVIYTLVREFVDARLAKRGLPVATKEYASEEHKIEF